MTAVDDGIEMADTGDGLTLDTMFQLIEQMGVPEGYKVEVVEGAIHLSPQRAVHWDITANIIEQLRAGYPRQRLKSDVRIDFPGRLNGFATDVTALAVGAEKDEKGAGATRTSSSSPRSSPGTPQPTTTARRRRRTPRPVSPCT